MQTHSASPFHLCKDTCRCKISSYFSTAFKHMLNLSTSKFSWAVHMLTSPFWFLNSDTSSSITGKKVSLSTYLTCSSQFRAMVRSDPVTSWLLLQGAKHLHLCRSTGQIPKHTCWRGKRHFSNRKYYRTDTIQQTAGTFCYNIKIMLLEVPRAVWKKCLSINA